MSGSGGHVLAAEASAIVHDDGHIGSNRPESSWAAVLAQTPWRKSSWSACNGNCVEAATLQHDRIGVRDSKEAGQGPVLVFDGAAWRSFIESVKNGS